MPNWDITCHEPGHSCKHKRDSTHLDEGTGIGGRGGGMYWKELPLTENQFSSNHSLYVYYFIDPLQLYFKAIVIPALWRWNLD